MTNTVNYLYMDATAILQKYNKEPKIDMVWAYLSPPMTETLSTPLNGCNSCMVKHCDKCINSITAAAVIIRYCTLPYL